MKRIALLIFCAVLLLASCSSKPAPIVRSFSASAVVERGDFKAECLITSDSNSLVTVRITSPESLSGLCVRYHDGNTEIRRDGLVITADGTYQPDSSVPRIIFNILSSVGKENNCTYSSSYNDLAAFKGSCDSGKFTIYSDRSTGEIKRLELEDKEFTAVLSDFSATK